MQRMHTGLEMKHSRHILRSSVCSPLIPWPQGVLKKAQHPWTLAKAFKDRTPLGTVFDLPAGGRGPDLQSLTLDLKVNGKTRQHGSTADMLFKVRLIMASIFRLSTAEQLTIA